MCQSIVKLKKNDIVMLVLHKALFYKKKVQLAVFRIGFNTYLRVSVIPAEKILYMSSTPPSYTEHIIVLYLSHFQLNINA